MPYKDAAVRYKTKNWKLYVSHMFLSDWWDNKPNFQNNKTNIADAIAYIEKYLPHIQDYLLIRSHDIDWYELFIHRESITNEYHQTSTTSKQFIPN